MYNHYRFYVNVSICHSPTRNKTTLIHFHSIKVQTYTVWESGWVSLPFSNSLWHAHIYFFPFFYTYTKQYTHTKTNIIHIHHSFHVIFFSSIEIKRDTFPSEICLICHFTVVMIWVDLWRFLGLANQMLCVDNLKLVSLYTTTGKTLIL